MIRIFFISFFKLIIFFSKVYNRAGGCTRIFADWSLDDDGNIDSYGNVTVIPNSVIKEIKVKK